MMQKRIPFRTLFVAAALVSMLGSPAGAQQSTCVCTADYLGTIGGPPSRAYVNPNWSTCGGCPTIEAASHPQSAYNTATLREGMPLSRSLPEQEYQMWAHNMERQELEAKAQLRAASRTPMWPSDPVEAATAGLDKDVRTRTGEYRFRVENGELVMRGEVATRYQHDLAVGIAKERSGMPVRNELRLTSLGSVSDADLQKEIKWTLSNHGIQAKEIRVSQGTVQVMPSLSESDTVLIEQLPGVRAVR